MVEQSRNAKVRYILDHYPDCPQRDMALSTLRKGDVELSLAWLEALDEMMASGELAVAGPRAEKTARSG